MLAVIKNSIVVPAILLAAMLAVGQASPAHAPAKPHRSQDAALGEFSAHVKQYMDLREQKAGKTPKPTSSATKLVESREQMRARVQAARPQAKQGNVFSPRVAAYFRRQISTAFRGPEGARVLTSLRRAEPVKAKVQVNQAYPENIPLQSMPPSLLMKLPKLPKDLEYRIVDRDLVLRDTAANLVVDILPNAIPAA